MIGPHSAKRDAAIKGRTRCAVATSYDHSSGVAVAWPENGAFR